MPAKQRGGDEPTAAPAGYGSGSNSPVKAFKVDDSSLKALHKTFQMLISDVKEFNRQLGGIGKQGGIQAVGSALGRGGGSSGGGGGNLTTASLPQTSSGQNARTSGMQQQHAGFLSRKTTVAAVAGAVLAPGAYLSSNFSPIASMNYMGNQLARGAVGGYSMTNQNNAQRQLAGLTGYRNTSDLLSGAQSLSPFAGSFGSSRFTSTMQSAGSLANLNPSAGLAGAGQAMANLYAPQTNYSLMMMGAGGSIGAGGGLKDPQTIAQNLLTRVFQGKPWTAQMITQGMQPGSRLYTSLKFLDPQTQQYIADYGVAVANLGGDPKKVSQALKDPKGSLAKKAGLGTSSSMIASMNQLGRAQTGLQTNMGIDSAGTFSDAVNLFAKTVNAMGDVAGHGGGALGFAATGGMLGTGAAGKALNLGGGFLGYNLLAHGAGMLKNKTWVQKLLGGAETGVARGGGIKGAVTGAVVDSAALEMARQMGATPVFVMNWPGAAIGSLTGGSGGGLGKIGKLGKAGSSAEGGIAAGAEDAVAGGGGLSAIGGATALGIGAAGIAGVVGGQAITHIGKHNGQANKAARAIGDTVTGASGGALLGAGIATAALPMFPGLATVGGALVGGVVGGIGGAIKGGAIGSTLKAIGLQHSSANTTAYQNQYKSLQAAASKAGLRNVPGWVQQMNSTVNPLVAAAQKSNTVANWKKVINELTAVNKTFASQASATMTAAGNSNYARAFSAGSVYGSDPFGTGGPVNLNETGDSNQPSATGGSGTTWPEIEAMMNKGGPPHRVSATTNGQHAAGSYHYKGEAVDFTGTKPSVDSSQLLAINQWWAKNYGQELVELIYAGPGGTNIKNGKIVNGMSFYGAATMAEHHNHVHVAATPGSLGNSAGGVAGSSSGGSTAVTPGGTSAASAMNSVAANPSMEEVAVLSMALSAGGSPLTGAGATSTTTPGAASSGGSPSAKVAAAPISSSGATALGKQMAAAQGWSGNEWNALYQLWERESSWNPNAVNKSSGAYGIPQANPSGGQGHPYALGDAKSQIAWGLSYVKKRYGDPLKAWAHETGVGWYDSGAYNLGGDQAAVVHKGEMIIPSKIAASMRASVSQAQRQSQASAITSAPNSTGGSVHITLHAPVTLAGTATAQDAKAHVDNVISALQKSKVIASIGSGG